MTRFIVGRTYRLIDRLETSGNAAAMDFRHLQARKGRGRCAREQYFFDWLDELGPDAMKPIGVRPAAREVR